MVRPQLFPKIFGKQPIWWFASLTFFTYSCYLVNWATHTTSSWYGNDIWKSLFCIPFFDSSSTWLSLSFFFGNPFQGNVPTLPKATITRKLCVSRTAWRCISLTGPCGDCNLLQCLCCPHEEFHFFYQRNSFILPEKLFHFPLWRRRKVSPLLNPSAAQLTTLLVVCGHYKVVLPVNLLFMILYGI